MSIRRDFPEPYKQYKLVHVSRVLLAYCMQCSIMCRNVGEGNSLKVVFEDPEDKGRKSSRTEFPFETVLSVSVNDKLGLCSVILRTEFQREWLYAYIEGLSIDKPNAGEGIVTFSRCPFDASFRSSLPADKESFLMAAAIVLSDPNSVWESNDLEEALDEAGISGMGGSFALSEMEKRGMVAPEVGTGRLTPVMTPERFEEIFGVKLPAY